MCERKALNDSAYIQQGHDKYLQNLPGGQDKHSLSSCNPHWVEWVYVPSGQGWGTIVPIVVGKSKDHLDIPTNSYIFIFISIMIHSCLKLDN